jgi:hypothetical protein
VTARSRGDDVAAGPGRPGGGVPERPGGAAAPARSRPVPRAQGPTGAVGERPASPFAGLPISEIAIFVGAIGIIVGLIRGGGAALIVGLIVCLLGVVEVTAREHFSGYRSHTTLLAAIPAVGTEAAVVALVGEPRYRLLLLLVVVPIYAGLFWLLRRRFLVARQARLARPPAP